MCVECLSQLSYPHCCPLPCHCENPVLCDDFRSLHREDLPLHSARRRRRRGCCSCRNLWWVALLVLLLVIGLLLLAVLLPTVVLDEEEGECACVCVRACVYGWVGVGVVAFPLHLTWLRSPTINWGLATLAGVWVFVCVQCACVWCVYVCVRAVCACVWSRPTHTAAHCGARQGGWCVRVCVCVCGAVLAECDPLYAEQEHKGALARMSYVSCIPLFHCSFVTPVCSVVSDERGRGEVDVVVASKFCA